MKKYVITLSKTFPKQHKRSGEPTGFEAALLNALDDCDIDRNIKFHTIRSNFEFWEKRFAEIAAGDVESSNALCKEIVRRFNEFPTEEKL